MSSMAQEEVQTTEWEGDTPTDFDAMMVGSDGKDIASFPITEEEYSHDYYKDVYGDRKRQAEDGGLVVIIISKTYLNLGKCYYVLCLSCSC